MRTQEFMAKPGQHQSSIIINKLVKEGKKITNLWTNGEPGDQGVSIVEIDNFAVYIVDNGNATRDDTNNFGLSVRQFREAQSQA